MLNLGGAMFKHAKKLSKGANTIYFQQVNMKICRQGQTKELQNAILAISLSVLRQTRPLKISLSPKKFSHICMRWDGWNSARKFVLSSLDCG